MMKKELTKKYVICVGEIDNDIRLLFIFDVLSYGYYDIEKGNFITKEEVYNNKNVYYNAYNRKQIHCIKDINNNIYLRDDSKIIYEDFLSEIPKLFDNK